MSEEKKQQAAEAADTAPETTPGTQPDAEVNAAEQPADTAEAADCDAKEEAKPETKTEAKAEKEKKDWFGKKNREAEALKTKCESAEKKADELKGQLLRTAAEYENYRKRSAREADQKFNDGVSHAVTQILGILDTLDMAANAECSDENYKKGVTMTLDKAQKALATLNISEIDALGKPFDPNLMNAVQQVPPEDGQESGSVVRVFQKGYLIGDRIVRHATVVVAE